ncbi:unnamed protein product [Cunninghamella echinulata]
MQSQTFKRTQSHGTQFNNCLRLLHVPELKGIISKLNEAFHWKLLRTGRKNEIIFRIIVSINKVLEFGNSIQITTIFDILRLFQCHIPEDVKVLIPQLSGPTNQNNNNNNNNNSNNNNNIPSASISTVPRLSMIIEMEIQIPQSIDMISVLYTNIYINFSKNLFSINYELILIDFN